MGYKYISKTSITYYLFDVSTKNVDASESVYTQDEGETRERKNDKDNEIKTHSSMTFCLRILYETFLENY